MVIFLSFTERVTDDYVYDLLYSAKEAHMNMLRVWGGKFVIYVQIKKSMRIKGVSGYLALPGRNCESLIFYFHAQAAQSSELTTEKAV